MTPWTVARQAPLSMGFPRREYWSGLPFPLPGNLPDPGIKLCIFCIGRQILYHQGRPSIIDLKFPSAGIIPVDSNDVGIRTAESRYEHAEVTWEGACSRALENLSTRRAESSTTSANSHVWVEGF